MKEQNTYQVEKENQVIINDLHEDRVFTRIKLQLLQIEYERTAFLYMFTDVDRCRQGT